MQVSIIIGVVVGVITGVYTGLVVMRIFLFSQYKHLIMQATKEVEYCGSSENGSDIKLDSSSFPNTSNISHNSSFMLYLGHSKAGHTGLSIFKEMMDAKYQYSRGVLDFKTIEYIHSKWQNEAMNMAPDYVHIFCLRGGQ